MNNVLKDLAGKILNPFIPRYDKLKNIITVSTGENFNYSATERYQQILIPVNNIKYSNGNLLSVKDGKIVIGKGVKKVMVSAQMSCQLSKLTSYGFILKKNDIAISRGYESPAGTGFSTISLSNAIFSVEEGDEISIYLYIDLTDCNITVRYDNSTDTYLTVQVID